MKLLAPVMLLCVCGAARATFVDVPATLRACGDAKEFAPYTYTQPGNAEVAGYNADVLRAILAESGRSISITLLPWNRCLTLAAAGDYAIVLDAAQLGTRAPRFAFPRPHYSITPALIYRKAALASVPRAPAELAQYTQCQIAGWDYSMSGFAPRPNSVVLLPTLKGALAKLRAGECQIVLADEELLARLQDGGPDLGAGKEALGVLRLPWRAKVPMYLMVSRARPFADALVELLSAGIERMEKSGEAARLLARHLQP